MLLNIPPLAERIDDVLPLVEFFLPGRDLSLSAQRQLTEYNWPGNVRELENACKRVGVLKPDGILEGVDFALPKNIRVPISSPTSETGNPPKTLGSTNVVSATVIPEPDKEALLSAMERHEGIIARVAKEFGMTRQTLYRRLKKHGIDH